MPDREKLIELLSFFADGYSVENRHIGDGTKVCEIADHLIANGVTFATDNNVGGKWIPVTERLPTIYDADADNCVLAIHKASNKRYYHWRSVADNPFDFTYWMRTPQPPKGE